MALLRSFMPFEFMFIFLICTVTNNAFVAAMSRLNVHVTSDNRLETHLPQFLTTVPAFCLTFIKKEYLLQTRFVFSCIYR
jgi:hypothetical protein